MSTFEVKVPDIGDFSDVEIIEVHVAIGDRIGEEEPLITLESDKASMEVPSTASGTILELKVAAGDKVSQDTVVALLKADADAESATPVEPPSPQGHQESDAQPIAQPRPELRAPKKPVSDFTQAHASPAVRRLARELDVDLNTIDGTGNKGRITKDDVKAYLSTGTAQSAAQVTSSGTSIPEIPAVDFSKFGAIEEIELPRVKKISGAHLHRCWLNVPAVTHNDESDITDTDKFRKELDNAAKDQGYRVTLLSFLMKASVSALKKFPDFNSSLSPGKDKLIRKHFVHIGIAVDTPNGLVVPVIRDCDQKGIDEISSELGGVSKRARAGKLSAEDMQGGSFTISSLGGIGGTGFSPIVNTPEVAILGVARSKMAPVWNGTEFVARNMLPICLSYDHRVIDGAAAARFTRHLCLVLEDVRRLVL